MQHFVYAFLIALTNNFDNIGARIAYSIRGIKISSLINLWISVITFVISFLAAFSGTLISGTLGGKPRRGVLHQEKHIRQSGDSRRYFTDCDRPGTAFLVVVMMA